MTRVIILLSVIFAGTTSRAYSQVTEAHPAVGIEPYHHPHPAKYRLIVGAGINASQFNGMPLTEFAEASLRRGKDLFSFAVLQSASSSRYPRTTLSEFDLLYGYAYEYEYSSVGTSPVLYHFAISSGIAFDTYSERWRRSRRMTGDFITVHPNIFEYSVGLPVQVQAIFEPGEYFGFGMLVNANISKFQPSYGILLGVEGRY
jgi:hypothetical protein